MSSIVDQVTQDMRAAMKARDKQRTGTLRMVRAAFIEAEKAGKGDVSNDDAVKILRRMVKQRIDAASQYDAGDRPELAAVERAEVQVIDGYLPKQADEATTRAWVQEAVARTGATSMREMGKVMGLIMKEHKGLVDGKLAKTLIQAELNS